MAWHLSKAMIQDYGSSHFSPEQEAEFSEESCLDGERSAPSKSKIIVVGYSCRDKMTESYSRSQSGTMCGRLTEDRGEALLTWFREVFLARDCQPQEKDKGSAIQGRGFGLRWPELFAKYDPSSSSWKTHQDLFATDSKECSVTLPRSGTMLNGCLSPATPLAQPQRVSVFGYSLPRPTKSHGIKGDWGFGAPTNNRYSSSVRYATRKLLGKKPTPSGVEWLMAWPIGWSGLEPLETGKIQSWLQAHGEYSGDR